MVALPGGGVDTAGQLLVTAGDSPGPIALGTFVRTPVRRRAGPGVLRPHRTASTAPRRRSRRQQRPVAHRPGRMRCHQPVKDYVARRTDEGRTKKEILRCLRRYIAREIYPRLLR